MFSDFSLTQRKSYTLRCAIIDVCGNLIAMLSKQQGDERAENLKKQMDIYFEVLEDRFLDISPYCRSRVIQVYIKLCDLDTQFRRRRQRVTHLAAESLKDKTSNVRRNAIKLLSKLVTTHSFNVMHNGLLIPKDWTESLEQIEAEIDSLKPPEEQMIDETLLQDATQAENDAPTRSGNPEEMSEAEKLAALEEIAKREKEAQDAQLLSSLHAKRKYHTEALKFINMINDATESVIQLLSSKNKSEINEAMDFFTVIDAYKIPNARIGIRRMLRLIWTKGNNDEGKSIQAHLIECYKSLFFDAPPGLDANDSANYIAKNMISLTAGTTPAELTSLEQLLSTMMQQKLVNDLVIQKLWQVYGVEANSRSFSRSNRRGAIIILGMLALARPGIIVEEMETCLRIGLGPLGRRDLSMARYTCIALRRISSPLGKQSTGATPEPVAKLPNDHAVLVKLAAMCEIISDSKEWFGVAEQAIGAIYVLSKHPEVLCSEIIRRKTKYVFAPQTAPRATSRPTTSGSGTEQASRPSSPMEVETPQPVLEEQPKQQKKQNTALALSQLLFIVGHVAIKQIVQLELCELEFKRRKAEKEKKAIPTPRESLASKNPSPVKRRGKKSATKEPTPAPEVDELDLMAGTTEDDFTEAIANVRERELLYGPQSLLANFGPMVAEICANNTSYNHPTLQAQAALCLAKLMCVSSEYCESNLQLLLTILERSKDAVVRSNLVVALGDMAVCFNHLIDENTDFLYRRLNDGDPSVKRTCLMTLTFLILAGQVKVKGQLGEMAKCIEDSDKRIAEMARTFFSELATKDNAVYNQFVDMFSVLSADTGLHQDAFKKIIKFLAGFIEKVSQNGTTA